MLITLSSAVLAFSLAGTASASTAVKSQSVKVILEDKVVDFGADLVVTKGKTFVEYKALLKQLGYETEFDQSLRTIYAEAEEMELQFSVGGDVAFVNGLTLPSTGEVIEQNGKTLVGLRFAGALTNHDVEWDNKAKSITLSYSGPSAQEKAAVYEVFNKMLLIEAAGDAQGLKDLMAEDTVMDIASVSEGWKTTKTKTKIEKLAIQSYSDTSVVVVLVEDTSKVSGGFFPDNKSQTRYTLHKDKAGSWKIYSIEVLAQQYTNIPGLFEQKATIPETENTSIRKIFDDQIKAANEQNVDAYVATLVDFAEKETLKTTLTDLFKSTTMNITAEKWAIVEYNGSDKAKLLVSTLNEVETGGTKSQNRAIILNDAEKVNGKWLLKAEAVLLSNEQL
ncbi:copper amine oxidase N-terminal domain-containing protein [Cohnella herbarum]|nr:copper amine oxidase N-terminal domain-containing protein [Cohnella herbarum]